MRVLIDTNVLISAALKRNGLPYLAFEKAVVFPNHGVVCDQNLDEMREVFVRKFPHRMADYETFLSVALAALEVVPVPELEQDKESKIRDIKDRPILRAAISAGVDVLLTGDKDFLDSGIKKPLPVTPADFLKR